MRKLWKTSVALSLGLLASGAGAGDEVWRPTVAPHSQPSVRTVSEREPLVTLGPPVSLGRPVPLEAAPPARLAADIVDSQVRPTAFRDTAEPTIVFPMASPPEAIKAKPVQVAPAAEKDKKQTWTKAPEPVLTPEPAGNGGSPIVGMGPVWGMYANGGDPCCDPCCDPCAPMCCAGPGCCFDHRWYVSAEYLVWWLRASPTPVLVSTGSLSDGAFAGASNRAATQALFGGDNVGTEARSGGRLRFGYFFTDDHCIGLDFGAFFLGSQGTNFSDFSRGERVLARPFFDTIQPNAEAVANLSRGIAGGVDVRQKSNLWGAEVNVRSNVWCGCCMNLDLLAGFRSLGLDESIEINERLVVLGNTPNTAGLGGSRIDITDSFKTSNRFYGGQLGAIAEFKKGRWFLDLSGRVGIGMTQQIVDINGGTTIVPLVNNVPGTVFSGPGGLLTGATTNIGHYSREKFSVVPELGINVGYQCTPCMRLFVGYNLLYWSNVVRPGAVIDTTVNPLRVFGRTNPNVPGPASPAFLFRDSDFWAQGINFGMEFRF